MNETGKKGRVLEKTTKLGGDWKRRFKFGKGQEEERVSFRLRKNEGGLLVRGEGRGALRRNRK